MQQANITELSSSQDTQILQLDTNVEFAIEEELRNLLRSKIVGQNTSTDKLASIIASRMYSIAPRKGPIAIIYLPGPTGVGKTETCHALAEYFFGDPNALVKIAGEDYQDRHASRNLFGAVKTYVGYGEPTPLNDTYVYAGYNEALESGKLNTHIKDKFKNFSIVLIDEVEKMHTDTHQNFLGIFDKGEFRFPSGKEHNNDAEYSQVTDFSNTIFILTSNIGERETTKSGIGFSAKLGGRQENGKDTVMKAIQEVFSPEFRGRITEFLCYEPLERNDIEKICSIYVNRVADCLKSEYDIMLNSNQDVVSGLVDIFEDEKKTSEGARGLQKIVQDRFDGVLARIIHSGQLNQFSGHIQINSFFTEKNIGFSAQSFDESGIASSLTFGEKLRENIKSNYRIHTERDLIIQMYKRIGRASYFSNINYAPYLLSLEKKLMEYGFSKIEITELDNEICKKVEGEIDNNRKGKKKRLEVVSSEEIFYPFSIEDMQDLMLKLWRGQVESTNKLFKRHHTELRLVLIQKAIRDTVISFFGHNIRKDQSIWISQEIHKLYLKAKSSIR